MKKCNGNRSQEKKSFKYNGLAKIKITLKVTLNNNEICLVYIYFYQHRSACILNKSKGNASILGSYVYRNPVTAL